MTFSDEQRAAIFVRDRALCGFSGKSLWILDYGAAPFWDWADHMKPFSRGGKSVIENGVCVGSLRNWKRRNNTADNTYLFHSGEPTVDAYYRLGSISREIGDHLRRLERLHPSDWYFNHALAHILLWLTHKLEYRPRERTQARKRCRIALEKLRTWRQLRSQERLHD